MLVFIYVVVYDNDVAIFGAIFDSTSSVATLHVGEEDDINFYGSEILDIRHFRA
jgi:hypothetical protein